MGLKLEIGDNVRVTKASGMSDIVGHSGSIDRTVSAKGRDSRIFIVRCRTCGEEHELHEEAIVHEAEIWAQELEATLDDIARLVRNGGLRLFVRDGAVRFEFVPSHSTVRGFTLSLERSEKS
jgi:hypothetical protein